MSDSHTGLFVQRELAGSIRARWFAAYTIVFLVGGVLLAAFGAGDTVIHGYRGFARAFAGMAHLALVFVPLMALFPAAGVIADERERGGLEYILAQPVTAGEVYVGKWAGIGAAVLLSLTLGFGASGALAVWRGVPAHLVLTLYLFLLLLALTFVSLGLCFSAAAASRARATTLGIVLWLVLAALGTLGVMAAFIRWGLPASALVTWTFVNPIEAFRLGILTQLDPDLSLLGPVGAAIIDRLGSSGTAVATALSLTLWAVVPGVIGWRVFSARH